MLFMEYVYELVDRVIDHRGLVRSDQVQPDREQPPQDLPVELPKAS